MKQQTPYFKQLDALRCYALIIVCLAHWHWREEWIHVFRLGPMALEMFFVLSGFLITGILLRSKKDIESGAISPGQGLKVFYLRRILRVFPAFYAVLLITYIFNEGTVRDTILWNALYGTNFYLMKIGDWAGTITHFWSLAVEEHFYLIWPFLIFFVPEKYLLKSMFAVVLAALFLRTGMAIAGASFVSLHVFSPLAFDGFGIGGILAWLYIYQGEKLANILDKSWLFGLIFLAVLTITLSRYFIPEMDFLYLILPRTLTSILFFWVVGKAVFGFKGYAGKFLENKIAASIGKISYAAYLYHNFVPGFYMDIPLPDNEVIKVFIYFLSTILVAYLSLWLIEQPFNNLKKKIPYSYSRDKT